jgi:hypothetical protein
MGKVNIPVRLNNTPAEDETKKFGILTQFKGLNSGAGSNIFKTDKSGVFVGGNKYATAPFRLDYNGNIRMGPLTDAGIGFNGSTGTVDFYWDNAKVGFISGFIDGGDNSEECYVYIKGTSDRYIKVQESMISINGNLNPSADSSYTLGTTGTRWSNVYTDEAHVTNGDDFNDDIVVAIRDNSGTIEYKKRNFTMVDGIVTNVGSESDWLTA